SLGVTFSKDLASVIDKYQPIGSGKSAFNSPSASPSPENSSAKGGGRS
ncbi:MAG: hypothetical protein ACJATL_000502, partial [Rickettsiales bacterium]